MRLLKTPSILIVEDERLVARDLQLTLRDLGYDAFAIASTSDEAMAEATRRCPDLVLMDIRIKGERDGVTTAGLMRTRFQVPVVFLTAHADEATIQRAAAAEPYGYLVKPIKMPDLRGAIEVALHKHQLDRRLRERERWFSTTLASIADAVVTVDLSGRVTYLNPVAERLLGLPVQEARGRAAREVVRLENAAGTLSPLDEALASRRPLHVREAKLVAADHTTRLIADSAAPVDDDGELLGAVMVFRDVTEERALRARLEFNDRLASLGTMAAGVAHEVNNPLSVVLANAAYLSEQLSAAGDEVREPLSELRDAADRIRRIVGDLKTFSRPPTHESEEAEVDRAIQFAVRATRPACAERARVQLTVEPGLRVCADGTRLSQVLINLIVNAAHAIPTSDGSGTIELSASRRGAQIVFEVKDSGVGIAPEILPRIFDPFFTTKTIGKGTGLGLSVSRGIVSSLGGELTVRSTVGQGATFSFWLPAAAATTGDTVKPQPRPRPTSARVLVVDDDPFVTRAVERSLLQAGHLCTTASSAAEVLTRLERELFDVIVCDLSMPEVSGMELYEQVLSRWPAVAQRFVFMSGGAVSASTEAFRESVSNRVIDKPLSVEVLLEAVRAVCSAAASER